MTLFRGLFFLYSKDSDKIDFIEKMAEITLKKTCFTPNPERKTLNQKKMDDSNSTRNLVGIEIEKASVSNLNRDRRDDRRG